MGIIWLIIKIILWTILICIGLLVAVGVILLLAPIRYEVYLEKYEVLNYEIKVRYLGVVKGDFHLQEGIKHQQIKVFGKRLYFEERNLYEVQVEEGETFQEEASDAYCAQKAKGDEICSEHSIPETTRVAEDIVLEKTVKDYKSPIDKKKLDKRKTFDWRNTLSSISDLYGVVKGVYRLIKALLLYLKPKEWSFEFIVGREDPADTGELMAKLIMLYPLYYKHGAIKGNYEKAMMSGGFLAEGKFCVGGILKHIIAFLWYKPVRKSLKRILQKGREE